MIGTPIKEVAVSSGSIGRWRDGRSVAYLPLIGTPSRLVIVDIAGKAVLRSFELRGTEVCWSSVVAPDGTVYIGCQFGARLFRYSPREDRVESLGSVVPDGAVIWGMTTDSQGRLFGGVFSRDWPAGKVFSYDPVKRRFTDLGPVTARKPLAQYVRDVAVYRNKLYAGLGTTGARLFEIDLRSGAQREIRVPTSDSEVTTLDVRDGLLFVRTTPSGRLFAYDLRKRTWSRIDATLGGRISEVRDGLVYYVNGGGRLSSYDLKNRKSNPVAGDLPVGTSRGFGWARLGNPMFPGETLVSVAHSGKMWAYNPATGATGALTPKLPGQPRAIHTMTEGPGGNIFVTAYPSGGLSAYSPASGRTVAYPPGSIAQTEGMLSFGGKLYLGTYPGANLLSLGADERLPEKLGSLSEYGQDRPFALAAVDGLLAIGTVPDYGKLGGALALLDPRNGRLTAHRDIVKDHSVTALAGSGAGVVYGGTSVWGGMGIRPSGKHARLFAFDVRTKRKFWDVPVLQGERAITALRFAPDGTLWGITAGKVFSFDVKTRKVVRVLTLKRSEWPDRLQVWRSGELAFSRSGSIYALVFGTLYEITPTSLTPGSPRAASPYARSLARRGSAGLRVLAKNVSHFTLASDGTLYLARGTNLFTASP